MPEPSSSSLQIGQSGELGGQRYQIAGRIQMSMVEEGVTYRWDEYHLIGPHDTSATLVQEEGEHGPEWRMFRLLEPAPPITAAEAATRRVGDSVEFSGTTLRVTCVDESRVVRVEGQAPEGVEEGDVAHYFNAESGNQMFVVSWTGDEVEVFRGVQLPGHAVYRAFGLTPPSPKLKAAETPSASSSGVGRKIMVAIVLGVIGLGVVKSRGIGCNRTNPSPKAVPVKVPPPRLAIGSSATINGTLLRVTGRATVEISRVGRRHARQEYYVVVAADTPVLLVQGGARNAEEWEWLRPIEADGSITPRQAATNQLGATLMIAQTPMRVTSHFLTSVQSVEGATAVATGTQLYGLVAQGTDKARVVVRWDENTVTLYKVSEATKKEIQALGGK